MYLCWNCGHKFDEPEIVEYPNTEDGFEEHCPKCLSIKIESKGDDKK